MNIKRYLIILVATISAITGYARSADEKTFERLYNLSHKQLQQQRIDYILINKTDSAILCANFQASKYGKEKLSTEEIEMCGFAFRYMGIEYLQGYYNYQLAAENLLKAEQIADKYGFIPLKAQLVVDKAILAATQNDLENNFGYNKDVIDGFKKSLQYMLEQSKSKNSESNRILVETSIPNLLYLAIKFDKAKEVTDEVQAYREAQKRNGVCCNVAQVMCDAIDAYNASNYDKAFEALQTPINHHKLLNDKDFIEILSIIKMAQYVVLLKSGKRTEALNLLLQHEQTLRDNGMTFGQLEALQLIWQHHEADGNKAMADKYALQYYITKDEFFNKSQVGKMDQAKLNVELEQTRERISEMSYRQRMQAIVLWSAIIIALLALALLGVLWVNYRKTRRTNRLLYEKNVALLAANQELRPASAVPAASDNPEKPASGVPSQADRDLMEKITAVMESSDEIYHEDFSLQRLADLVASNTNYVSRAINICGQRNFNVLLNEYRIKEACRRLMDSEHYGSYSIEGIARSVGYKSRSNFTLLFKSSTGLTPSAFQKMCREGNASTM